MAIRDGRKEGDGQTPWDCSEGLNPCASHIMRGIGPQDLGRNISWEERLQRAPGPEEPQGPVGGVLGRNLRKKRSPEGFGRGQSHRIYIPKVNSTAIE